MEYHSFLLCGLIIISLKLVSCFRLLAEYHSFLFTYASKYTLETMQVSVSLRSIIHSYKLFFEQQYTDSYVEFLSPYGVSFILINAYQICVENGKEEFPSPYGVSFILILWSKKAFIAICF